MEIGPERASQPVPRIIELSRECQRNMVPSTTLSEEVKIVIMDRKLVGN